MAKLGSARDLVRRWNRAARDVLPSRALTAEEALTERINRMTSEEMHNRLKELEAIARARLAAGAPRYPLSEDEKRRWAALEEMKRRALARFANVPRPRALTDDEEDDQPDPEDDVAG